MSPQPGDRRSEPDRTRGWRDPHHRRPDHGRRGKRVGPRRRRRRPDDERQHDRQAPCPTLSVRLHVAFPSGPPGTFSRRRLRTGAHLCPKGTTFLKRSKASKPSAVRRNAPGHRTCATERLQRTAWCHQFGSGVASGAFTAGVSRRALRPIGEPVRWTYGGLHHGDGSSSSTTTPTSGPAHQVPRDRGLRGRPGRRRPERLPGPGRRTRPTWCCST